MNANSHKSTRAGDTAADWPCPYPHLERSGVRRGAAATSVFTTARQGIDAICTDPTCSQPLQYCPSCGASNRVWARFCRNCRQSLAFDEAVLKSQTAHEIDAKKLIKEFRQIELPALQSNPITALASSWGYVLAAAPGWGLGVLANTHLQPPRWLLHFAEARDEAITGFQPMRHPDLLPGFLAAGTRQIYQIDFLPALSCRTLFRLPDPAWTIAGTLFVDTKLVVRVWHQQSGWYRWLTIDCKTRQVQALPFQQRSGMSEMIALPVSGKLLYHTMNEIVELDLRAGSEYRRPGPAAGLNIKVRPQLFARTGDMVMHGLDGALYRYNVAARDKAPEVFGRGRHELVHIFLSASDDYLYLLCHDNLVLIDYPSGAAIWNSQQHAKTMMPCGALPPQQWGNYLMFSLRNSGAPGAAERVALFSFGQRSAPLLLHPAVAQTPAPAGGLMHLIAVRAQQDRLPGAPSTLLLFQL